MHKPSPLWPPPEPVTADSHGQTNFDVSTSPTSTVDERAQSVSVDTGGKRTIALDSQVQFYTQNHLLSHPLVSPCNAYLGGLPPLFFTAGDNEVLRDEIIHTCVFSLHCYIPSPNGIPEPIEQQIHLISGSRLKSNSCIPRSGNTQRKIPIRLWFTFKFTMGVHISCPSSLRSPLLQNTVSERSPIFVVSRLRWRPSLSRRDMRVTTLIRPTP